jgi:hypothetical protein
MDKRIFGAIITTSLLNEGVMDYIKRNKEAYNKARFDDTSAGTERKFDDIKKAKGVAGVVGTGLGKTYGILRQAYSPSIGTGLQRVGEQVAITGRNIATKIGTSSVGLGKKIYDKGISLETKYKK